MRAVIVAGGDVDLRELDAIASDDLVLAADGGAIPLVAAGRRPAVLIGDLDSVTVALVEELAAAGVTIDGFPDDKDASDLELAVERAVADGATQVVIFGAFGGERLDHALAAGQLLAAPAFREVDVRAVHRGSTVRAAHPDRDLVLDGAAGDLVTLLPVGGDAHGVSTSGLRWPLSSETLRFGRSRGLSNEVAAAPAMVRVGEGTLLVIETAQQELSHE
jgi:thiamine pyrophosphokinase